jgi:hypothetical protein
MSVVQLRMKISEADSDDQRIDYLANNLVSLLNELDIEYIGRSRLQRIETGHKGDPITAGAIILGIAVASLPSLIEFIQNWTGERRKVSIEAPNGVKIEFIPEKKYSQEELLALVEKLSEFK